MRCHPERSGFGAPQTRRVCGVGERRICFSPGAPSKPRTMRLGWESNKPQRPALIVIILLQLPLLRQHRRHRFRSHRVFPQNHIQLLCGRSIRMPEVHLHALFSTDRLLRIRRIDQAIVAVRIVRRIRRLIARPGEQRAKSTSKMRRCCSSAAAPAASPSSGPR